jgi:hypothetical protein
VSMPNDYGPLSDVVAYAGHIVAAIAAIGLAWRGRTRWEPSEEDLSKGPQKVGALVAAVAIVLVWAAYGEDRAAPGLRVLAVALAVLTLLGLLIYLFLIASMSYEKIEISDGKPRVVKVIGGYRLTEGARSRLRDRPSLTVQQLFKGSAYDPARVWTVASRALAKLSFVGCYLLLTISGSVALAVAAVILSNSAS